MIFLGTDLNRLSMAKNLLSVKFLALHVVYLVS